MNETVFGSRVRDDVLKFIALAGQTYPSELAAVLGSPVFGIQRAVNSLEKSGLLVTRLTGNVRLVDLNPAWFARKELRELLLRLAQYDDRIKAAAGSVRRKPRRAGKTV